MINRRNVVLMSMCFIVFTISLTSCSAVDSEGESKELVSTDDYNQLGKDHEAWVEASLEAEKDLYRILVAMSSLTTQTLSLERQREMDGTLKGKPMAEQVQQQLAALKAELEDVRQKAATNDELTAEVNEVQNFIENKEREISRLQKDIHVIDEGIKEAIDQIKAHNEEIAQENELIRMSVQQLQETKKERLQTDQLSWILAGDELVTAAKMIPKASSYSEQSSAIIRSKQLLLNYAIESCYNVATRMDRSTPEAKEASAKGYAALDYKAKVQNRDD